MAVVLGPAADASPGGGSAAALCVGAPLATCRVLNAARLSGDFPAVARFAFFLCKSQCHIISVTRGFSLSLRAHSPEG